MDYSKYFEQLVNIGSGILAILALSLIVILIMVILPFFSNYIDSAEKQKKKNIENIVITKVKEIEAEKDSTKKE